MDETRLNRLREELDKAQKKRQELDAKVKKLEQRVREAENTYIHDIVHAANITPEQLGKLIRILGNAGLEEAGEAADLTEKNVMRAIKPMDLMEKISACMDAINEGMVSEIPEKKDEGPVDVTLEEMKKKEVKGD